MKNKPLAYLAVLAGALAVLAVVLALINPLAPLFLLASLVIQAPIVFVIGRVTVAGGYNDRAYERRKRYEKDGDAAALLAAEEKEAASVGYRYWPRGTKNQNALSRAEALAALSRRTEAAERLAAIDEKHLGGTAKQRYAALADKLRLPPP